MMADFEVVEGELVPIDASGNPLPIADGGTIGSTPGIILAGKEGSAARFLEVTDLSGSKHLRTSPKNEEISPLFVAPPPYFRTDFGEFRTASPFTLADINFKYEIDSTEFGTSVATGGTVTYNSSRATASITVTGSNGSRARLRTHTFFRYQSGKSQAALLTCFHSNAGETNQIRRWGYFGDNDGLFFELNGTTLQLVRRTSTSGSPVDNVIPRATWNGDKLDGSGPSGITLDLTRANLYEIHMHWLGVANVRFYVNGILVHTATHANTLTVPYMRTAKLPIQWEIVNTGASTGATMEAICCSVKSLGGDAPPEYTYAAYNATDISVGTTERPILSIRPKSTYGGINNRMLILPVLATIKTEGSRAGWTLRINPTLTGASFNSVNAKSGVEFDVAATSFTGGEVLFNGFLPNSNDKDTIYLNNVFSILGRKLRRDAFDTTGDILTVTAYNEAAGSTNMRGSISWGEVRLCLSVPIEIPFSSQAGWNLRNSLTEPISGQLLLSMNPPQPTEL